jgi:DEAD/DEAH box helicase
MGRKAKKQQYKNYGKISQRKMTTSDVDAVDDDEVERLRAVVRHGVTGDGAETASGLPGRQKASESGLISLAGTSSLAQSPSAPPGAGATKHPAEGVKQNVASGDDDKAELDRIRAMLRDSTDHLRPEAGAVSPPSPSSSTTGPHVSIVSLSSSSTAGEPTSRYRKRPRAANDATSSLPPNPPSAALDDSEEGDDGAQRTSALLDAEMVEPPMYGAEDPENVLVLSGGRKKKRKEGGDTDRASAVELTPHERKQALKAAKNASRKLAQLERKAVQKQKRAELYEKLQHSALSSSQMQLLHSSSSLGGHMTQKQQLAWLVKKERAGLALTEEERTLLYRERSRNGGGDDDNGELNNIVASSQLATSIAASSASRKDEMAPIRTVDDAVPSTGAGKSVEEVTTDVADPTSRAKSTDKEQSDSEPSTVGTKAAPSSYASQLMASLQRLKATATTVATVVPKNTESTASKELTENASISPDEAAEKEESTESGTFIKPPVTKRYVPPEPVVLKSAAALGLTPSGSNSAHAKLRDAGHKVITIQRPPEVQAARYDLPVATMEFEVMDAIRNHDVTILCSETGSGKSTQVPQFLYEYGYASDGHVIGITQPRRVAAVSTAKRVAYEMGTGNGSTISSRSKKSDGAAGGTGNEVAYQTRYESAGLGTRTRIKFMTDGLLLQEIRTDLLLRKYSVIVLDEAHERNLNTDVLIGLVSKSLVLRRQAKEEGSLPDLKLVIMSATLRVEDFTSNRLFSTTPAVVRIPGRNFPVTIHHSKVTELDNYGALGLFCLNCCISAFDAAHHVPHSFMTNRRGGGIP